MQVTAAEATSLGVGALLASGVPQPAAELQVDLLIEAELRGYPSHGLLRLPRLIERIKNGVLDPSVKGEHRWAGSALLVVDGQQGLGPVVALAALRVIIERARSTGIAAATITASNHLGMLAWYVEKVARSGQVGLAFTTSEALVHPWGGRRALVGSNPIAIGVPAVPEPLVFDMATSAVSAGKIIDYENRRAALEPNWALDEFGDPTTDATAARGGAISPFGGAKGYGLGLAFEVLVGAITGSALGRDVFGTLDSVHTSTKGDVFVVIQRDDLAAAESVGAYLDVVRSTDRQDPDVPVLVPGDRARSRRTAALARGLELPDELLATLKSLQAQGIPAATLDDKTGSR